MCWSASIAATADCAACCSRSISSRGNRWREEARAALAEAGLARLRARDRRQPALRRAEADRAGARPDGAAAAPPARRARGRAQSGRDRCAARAVSTAICGERGITLLVVEHDMQFVGALCEQVVVLNFGRKIAEGTPDEIREDAAGQGGLSRTGQRGRRACADGTAMRLEVHDLDVRYGRVHARARRLAQRSSPGEIVAVLGANGAGQVVAAQGAARARAARAAGASCSTATISRTGRRAAGCGTIWCWCRRAGASS